MYTALIGALLMGCWIRRSPSTSAPDRPSGMVADDPSAQLSAVYITKDVTDCPNWNDALARAQKRAACVGGKGDPFSRCQKKLVACKACDICPLLQTGFGPRAVIEPLGHSDGCTSRPWEMVCPGWGNWSSDWRVQFNPKTCRGPTQVDVLATTMVHEASHACPSIGGGAVFDFWPTGCTAYDIARECRDE